MGRSLAGHGVHWSEHSSASERVGDAPMLRAVVILKRMSLCAISSVYVCVRVCVCVCACWGGTMGSISPDLCRLEAMICLPATPNETCSLQLCFATHRHRYTEYPNILTAVGDQRTDAVKSTDNAV